MKKIGKDITVCWYTHQVPILEPVSQVEEFQQWQRLDQQEEGGKELSHHRWAF